jgi:hypothetical protein
MPRKVAYTSPSDSDPIWRHRLTVGPLSPNKLSKDMIARDDKPKVGGRTQRTPREPPEISAGLGSGRVERRMAALLALDIRTIA